VVTTRIRLIDVLETQNILGECPLWNARTGTLWWTDIQSSCLFRYDPVRRTVARFATPERLCSFAFVAESPRLIAAFASGVALYDPKTGASEWLYRLPALPAGVRFNDGRTDRDGRFWTGTMVEGVPSGGPPPGRLYRIDRGKVGMHGEAITVANAICASPDGDRLFYTDMPRHVIFVCDIDRETGRLVGQRVFAHTPADALSDGATVDAEGGVWNALWGAGRIARYGADGRVTFYFDLPVAQPTCLAFGGPKMNLMFVTTAREGLDPNALRRQPMAGNLLIYETDVTGLADAEYV
jgi:L-arabinonolactonase